MGLDEKKENKPAAEKVKVCPFSDIKCEDCRLYVDVPAYAGLKRCALIMIAWGTERG